MAVHWCFMADNKKALAMCSSYMALDLFLMHLHGATDRWLSANVIARPPVVDQVGSLQKLINSHLYYPYLHWGSRKNVNTLLRALCLCEQRNFPCCKIYFYTLANEPKLLSS